MFFITKSTKVTTFSKNDFKQIIKLFIQRDAMNVNFNLKITDKKKS